MLDIHVSIVLHIGRERCPNKYVNPRGCVCKAHVNVYEAQKAPISSPGGIITSGCQRQSIIFRSTAPEAGTAKIAA